MRTRWITVPMLLAVLAGCAPAAPQAPNANLAKTDQIATAAVEFARCMRDHGYSLPDPTFDEDGLPQYGELRDRFEKTPEFDRIRAECAEPLTAAYRAAGIPNPKQVDPAEFLGFARCMREHGIDMPDPTAEDPLAIPKPAFFSPAWEPAKQACQSLLPEAWRSALDEKPGDAKSGGGGR